MYTSSLNVIICILLRILSNNSEEPHIAQTYQVINNYILAREDEGL